jgi:arylsulfatase A-like enzyme
VIIFGRDSINPPQTEIAAMRRFAPRCPLALWTGLLAATLGGEASGVHARETDRPNIILILADDLGWGDLSYNGRIQWSTPHLDDLAARGARFDRFYTAGVVCAPSRAALLTGKNPIHCGTWRNDHDLPAEEVTIAEALKAKGYHTALYGKWHQGRPTREGGTRTHPLDQGFDETFGFLSATHAWEKFPNHLFNGRDRVEVPQGRYADDWFTDKGVEFIARHKDDPTPFFLYLPLTSTHFHIEAPEDEIAKHRSTFSDPIQAAYAAIVTRMDAQVGRIVQAVRDAGLEDSTLIVFTSDHGATFEGGSKEASSSLDSNHPFRGQKRTVYEGGIRVPGIMTYPGVIPAGRIVSTPVQTIDLLPTFLELAGGRPEPDWKVDGLNILPLATGREAETFPERTLFVEWRSEGYDSLAAIRGDYKLVVERAGKPELYHLPSDPAERINWAATRKTILQTLMDDLTRFMADHPDGPLTVNAPSPGVTLREHPLFKKNPNHGQLTPR